MVNFTYVHDLDWKEGTQQNDLELNSVKLCCHFTEWVVSLK